LSFRLHFLIKRAQSIEEVAKKSLKTGRQRRSSKHTTWTIFGEKKL